MTRNNEKALSVEKLAWALYSVMIVIPWHSTANNFLSRISIIGSITLLHLFAGLVIVFTIISFLANGCRLRKRLVLYSLYSVFIILYFFKGNAAINNRVNDIAMFLFQFAIFWGLVNGKSDNLSLTKFLSKTVRYININCIINLIVYLTKSFSFWGVTGAESGRFGGGYFALCLISGGCAIYSLFSSHEVIVSRKEAYLTLALCLFALFVSANRTNLLLFVVIAFAVYAFTATRDLSRRNVGLSVLFAVAVFAVLIYLFYGNSLIADRLFTGNSLTSEGNFKIRVSTFSYYMSFIFHHPMGQGFGYLMHFVHWDGAFLEDQLSVDNTLAYIGVKCGAITMVLFAILTFIRPLKCILRVNIASELKKCLIVMWGCLLVSTMLMTNQIVFSYAVTAFVWAFIAVLESNYVRGTGVKTT